MEKRELICKGKARRELDNNRSRWDLGGVGEAYHEAHHRVCTA